MMKSINKSKHIVFIALLFMLVLPQWLSPSFLSSENDFAAGIGDLILIVIGTLLLFGYFKKSGFKIIVANGDSKIILLIFALLIPSYIVDLVFGISIITIIANIVKFSEPLVVYFFLINYFGKEKIHVIETWLLIINVLINAIAIIQIINPVLYTYIVHSTTTSAASSYVDTFMYGRVASTLMNPGTFAWYLTVMIPFTLHCIITKGKGYLKTFTITIFISNIVLLIYTLSRTQWIALIGEIVVFLLVSRKSAGKKINGKWIIMFVLLAIIAFVLYREFSEVIYRRINLVNVDKYYNVMGFTVGYSGAFRFEAFKAGVFALRKYWLFGAGHSHIIQAIHEAMISSGTPSTFISSSPSLHNQFLNFILRCGIPIGIFIIINCFKLFNRFIKNKKINILASTLFIGVVISCMTGEILSSARILCILFAIFAYIRIFNSDSLEAI
jgi:hypothetical protein